MPESETSTTRRFAPLYKPTGNENVDRLAFFHILERLKVRLFYFTKADETHLTPPQTQKRTGWVDNNVSVMVDPHVLFLRPIFS